jgi:hypothetical protein
MNARNYAITSNLRKPVFGIEVSVGSCSILRFDSLSKHYLRSAIIH